MIASPQDWFLPKDQRTSLLPFLQEFKESVSVYLFSKSEDNEAYTEFTQNLLGDLLRLTDKITLVTHHDDDAACEKYAVEHFPTVLIQPDMFSIRFTGAPAGEEAQPFLLALLLVSTRSSHLSAASKEILAGLDAPRQVKVFVSPTCPYCPGQCVNAIKAAVERPDLVRMECVETGQNPDYAERYQVGSIPHTVYDETLTAVGLESEQVFMTQLVTLQAVQEESRVPDPAQDQAVHHYQVVIIGSGPAGLTAGIYARRAGLDAVVLEKSIVGGQVSITPSVENYPGFINVGGKMLMDMIHEQAKNYVEVLTGQDVQEIKVGKKLEVITRTRIFVADAVIYAAGADWKELGVPGEKRLMGKGVSFCASCDGYVFKDKVVVVVGGGNTALTDALHLKNLGVDVRLVHRREAFRAEQYLTDSITREGIEVRYNTVVEEIGGESAVEFVVLRDTVSGTTEKLPINGVFLAVGVIPNVQAVSHLGLALAPGGYLQVDRMGRTSLPRLYAAGDITGGVQQIVTAVSEGASAAMAVFEDLAKA